MIWCEHIKALYLNNKVHDWVYDSWWATERSTTTKKYKIWDSGRLSSISFKSKYCPWCGKEKPNENS